MADAEILNGVKLLVVVVIPGGCWTELWEILTWGFVLILTECEQISEWNRNYCVIKHNILFKAIGLSPGGNGYLTQIQKP
jgi:hypothetical protein